MQALQMLLADGIVDEILGQLKSGKEADVWLVIHDGGTVAAKIYKEREFRSFKNNAEYKEGRQVRNSRTQRAMNSGSKFGQKASEDAWKASEAETLEKLYAAGARVPKPVLFYEGVLLMEVVIDHESRVAPRLVDATIEPAAARGLYEVVRAQAVKMLCADMIHGDLSEFNVLLAHDGPVVIDFPQVVAAAHNSRSEHFFKRDIENVRRFFVALDPTLENNRGDADEIWRAYVRRDLESDFVPSGRPPPIQVQRPTGQRGQNFRGDPNRGGNPDGGRGQPRDGNRQGSRGNPNAPNPNGQGGNGGRSQPRDGNRQGFRDTQNAPKPNGQGGGRGQARDDNRQGFRGDPNRGQGGNSDGQRGHPNRGSPNRPGGPDSQSGESLRRDPSGGNQGSNAQSRESARDTQRHGDNANTHGGNLDGARGGQANGQYGSDGARAQNQNRGDNGRQGQQVDASANPPTGAQGQTRGTNPPSPRGDGRGQQNPGRGPNPNNRGRNQGSRGPEVSFRGAAPSTTTADPRGPSDNRPTDTRGFSDVRSGRPAAPPNERQPGGGHRRRRRRYF